jgi:hypothetical protein
VTCVTARFSCSAPDVAGDNRSIGGYAEVRDPGAVVEFVDKDPAFTASHPSSRSGVGLH